MKTRRLSIIINKPVEEVFEFTATPANTHKWIDGIEIEETNEMPPRVGTIYRNKGTNGKWNEYQMTEIEQDKMFVLSHSDRNYHVRYSFKPSSTDGCDFEYYEWVEEGELEDPFPQEALMKLKQILESR